MLSGVILSPLDGDHGVFTPEMVDLAVHTPGRHAPPAWQVLPAQQAPLSAPQFMHTLPALPWSAQPSPVLQLSPPQHAWPAPPHASHIAVPPPGASWQARPAVQVPAPAPLGQQG